MMIRADAQDEIVFTKINKITVETILEVQTELEPYDMTSLVFLLYEVPNTALERLITYHRVCRDVGINNLNLLSDWVMHAQCRPTWRYEFLEALSICRLNNIIKKLGFSVNTVKQHFHPDNVQISVYIHSMKKLLYMVSENMTYEYLEKLKQTLIMSYKIDVTQHEHCEMVFLELMCHKFITLNQITTEVKTYNNNTEVEKLAAIIENLQGLKKYAIQMREIVNKLNCNPNIVLANENSIPTTSKDKIGDVKYTEDVKELEHSQVEHKNIIKIKSDSLEMHKNIYAIINPKRVGVCCIINQEKFHSSKSCIESGDHTVLQDRHGSIRDQIVLEETMKSLNFIVKVAHNLKYEEVFEFIRQCIKFSTEEDSIFILCILSHGVMGHVYSSDSLKINVNNIQKMLDSDDALHLRDKPKVLILQACRVDETPLLPRPRLVADGPGKYLQKSNFLIYWATAPEYEAFRDEKLGSVFIQTLCYFLKKNAADEPLYDICTTVTCNVTKYCTEKQYQQVPLFESTLTKKLYLCPQTINNQNCSNNLASS